MSHIFTKMHLPSNIVEKQINSCLHIDSQINTPLARDNLAKFDFAKSYWPKDKDRRQQIAQILHLPIDFFEETFQFSASTYRTQTLDSD
jgi:hypothetical protein